MSVEDRSLSNVRLSNEHWHLKMGLEKAKSPDATKKIFNYFIEHPKDLDDAFFEKSLFAIAENAAKAFSEDPLLLQLAIDLFKILINEVFLDEQAKQLIRFFDKTNTRLQAFKKIFAQKSDYKDLITLATLADANSIEFFIQQYEEHNITNSDIWAFQNYLGWKNQELYLQFNKTINEKTSNKFILKPQRDFAKERKQSTQKDIDLLFNKEEFLQEIKFVFNIENKKEFTHDELLNLSTDNWANPRVSNLALYVMRNIAKDQIISLKKVTQVVNSWNWGWFCISEIYRYFQTDKELVISENQQKWINEWCYSYLNEVNFRTALVTKPKGQISSNWLAIYLWYFLRKLNLSYPKDVLLDMISFDWVEDHQMFGIQYLEEQLNEEDIIVRVLENLQKGIQNNDILKNHLDYCKRHNLKEVLPFALHEITNADQSNAVRRVALETFCEVAKVYSDLEQILPKITDDFKWDVIDQLVNRTSKYSHKFLLQILAKKDEQEQLKAAKYLIKLQDIEGLKYYVNWIRRHKQLSKEPFDRSTISYLRVSDSIPFLLELLEIYYTTDFVQDDFHKLDNIVLKTLTTIALQSEEHYIEVKQAVLKFINKYSSTVKNVNFLYVFIESLEQKYYVIKSEKLGIADVIIKLEKI